MDHSVGDTTIEKMLIQQAARQQQPINGSIELLPLCNMNCDMCYVRLSRKEMEQQGHLHKAEEWIQLGREMKDAGVLFLLLTGGEPLLFPDFKKLYLELMQMGMILTINTNGTLIDEDWAHFFGQYKPRRINITLYGADDVAYETLRHYPGGDAKTIKGIQRLKNESVDVKINGSVTKQNKKDMKRIYAIGQELHIPVHMDTYMLPGLHERKKTYEEQSRLGPVEAARADMETLKTEFHPEAFHQYVNHSIYNVQNADHSYTRQISCLAGNCSFTINWKGEMRPCVVLPKPSIRVFETGFSSAWNQLSTESKEFLLNSKCSTCSLRPICKTCVASALLETDSYDGVPDYLCQYTEEFLRLLFIEKKHLTTSEQK